MEDECLVRPSASVVRQNGLNMRWLYIKEASMFKRSSLLATLMLVLAALALPAQAASNQGGVAGGPPGPIQTADRIPTRSVSDRWIVRLAAPPLAQAPGISPGFATMAAGTTANGKLQIDSPA